MKRKITVISIIRFFYIISLSVIIFCFPNISCNNSSNVSPKVVEFEVPLGKTINGFTYSNSGELLFKGNSLRPIIRENTNDVKKFKVSILRSKNLAGAIALDDDGFNKLFFVDLGRRTSLPMPESGATPAAVEIFWSPSQKYMLALCSYEGERFIRIDLESKRIIETDFGPFGKTMRRLSVNPRGNPKWIGQTDVLGFTIDERCNYYDGYNCDNKVFATYKVRLEASSLKMTFEAINR